MRLSRIAIALSLSALVHSLPAARARAQVPPDTLRAATGTRSIEERLEEIDQRVRVIDRLRELEQEAAGERAKSATIASAGKDGFSLRSGDGAYVLKLRGYVQMDARFVPDGRVRPTANSFLLRRARPIVEGTVARSFDVRFMLDFGGGATVLQDGYVDARFSQTARLRAGKFKAPFGLERLQSATDLEFAERGLPTNLAPNRDLGVQLSGDLGGGTVGYAVGIFNGVADGGSADSDINNGKEGVARVTLSPFRGAWSPSLEGLGLAFAASWGESEGTPSATGLSAYRTPAQQAFFSYRSTGKADSTAVGGGRHLRLSPQLTYYRGPLSVMAEHVASSQEVRVSAASERLRHEAWQLTASYVLTGERASYKGVSPKRPFDRASGTRGAFEVVARHGRFLIDAASFPVYASSRTSAHRADSWGAGVNWYVNRNVKIALDYDRTEFEGGATGGDRPPEGVLSQRLQLVY